VQRLKSDVRIVGRKSGRHSDISLRPQSILSCNRPLVLFTFTVRCCPLLTNSLTLIFIKSQETYKESYLYDSMWDRQLVQMVLGMVPLALIFFVSVPGMVPLARPNVLMLRSSTPNVPMRRTTTLVCSFESDLLSGLPSTPGWEAGRLNDLTDWATSRQSNRPISTCRWNSNYGRPE
jgi:hypothetical protein